MYIACEPAEDCPCIMGSLSDKLARALSDPRTQYFGRRDSLETVEATR